MMILIIPIAAVMATLIGLAIDRILVGGHGIWYGPGEPPEWFEGFWDKGHVIVQWPTPEFVEVIEEDIRVQRVFEDLIVVNELSADRIVAGSITTEDIIHDPDNPGALTTKQELARRRLDKDR